MNRKTRAGFAIALFLSFASERAAHGQALLQGQIRGRVVEAATKVPVPGATITATSPNLGQPRIVTTNEDGDYMLPSLPIGLYRVTVSYAGVRPMTREIRVEPSMTAPLDFEWSPELAELETTTVVEERPITNPGSAQTGTVLSAEQIRYAPTASLRFSDPAAQVAGVSITGTTNIYIRGGRTTDNRYLFDGMDVTDPVDRHTRFRPSMGSIGTFQIITGGFDAEYNNPGGGGVINIISREGSDEWHGHAFAIGRHSSLSDRSLQGLLSYEGDRLFNTDLGNASFEMFVGASVGGPIIKHQLWFDATFEDQFGRSRPLPRPPLNIGYIGTYAQTYKPRLKLTWAPSAKQRLSLSTAIDDEAFVEDQDNRRLPSYLGNNHHGGINAVVNWNVFISPTLEFGLTAGMKKQVELHEPLSRTNPQYNDCNLFSERNCHYEREADAHFNRTDGTLWFQSAQLNSQGTDITGADVRLDDRTNLLFSPNLTWRGQWLGPHDAKVGFQLNALRYRLLRHQLGEWIYRDQGGGPLEDGLCDPATGKVNGCFERFRRDVKDLRFVDWVVNPGFFVQDHWRILKWLTVMPGVRFDWGRSYLTDGSTFYNMFAVGPRIGVAADVTGDQKTILSAHYGRANDVLELMRVHDYDQGRTGVTTTQRWMAATGVWQDDRTSGGTSGEIIDGRSKPPHVDMITASIRREITRTTGASLDYTWKKWSNDWTSVETNQIYDPTGFRRSGYVDGIPHTINVISTAGDSARNYSGFSLSLDGRPSTKMYYLASYTLAWVWNSGLGRGIPQQAKFNNGFSGSPGARHQIQLSGAYTFGFGLIVGARIDYKSGTPATKSFRATDTGTRSRSPTGTDTGWCSGNVPGQGVYQPARACANDVTYISQLVRPSPVDVNINLSYDLYPLVRQHIALSVDVLNALNDRRNNDQGAESIVTADDPSGGYGDRNLPNGPGIQLRLGARYDF